MLQQTAEIFHTIGLPNWLDRDFSMQHLICGHLKKIDMKDISTNRMVLHLLNEGKLAGIAALAGDLKLDEDIFTHCV